MNKPKSSPGFKTRSSLAETHIAEESERHVTKTLTMIDKIRRSDSAVTVLKYFHSIQIQGIFIIFTLWSLFSQDILLGWLPKSADQSFEGVTLIVFISFIIEIVLQTVLHRRYFMRFYFLLDVAGTLALLPDIILMFTLSGEFQYLNASSVCSASLNSTAISIIRVGKMARLLRAMRVVRAMKFVKYLRQYHKKLIHAKKQDVHEENSTIIGMAYSDLVSKRVVVGVILLLIAVPLLDVSTSDLSPSLSLIALQKMSILYGSSFSNPAVNAAVEIFMNVTGTPLLLNITGNVYEYDSQLLASRRLNALDITCTDKSVSIVVLDQQDVQTTTCMYNIILTVFTIFMFALGSWIFNSDAMKMIIEPLTKTMNVLRKVGKQMYQATFTAGENVSEVGVAEVTPEESEELEMNYVNNILSEMSQAFHISAEEDASMKLDLDKKLIEEMGENAFVMENPLHSVIPMPKVSNACPELETLDKTLKHPDASRYFRLFLMREMNIENLSFWEETMKYKTYVKDTSQKSYKAYIKDGAQYQVNISATQRAAIEKILDIPGAETFKIAEDEIFFVMRKDPYPRFLKSDIVEKHNQKSHIQIVRGNESRKGTIAEESQKKVV